MNSEAVGLIEERMALAMDKRKKKKVPLKAWPYLTGEPFDSGTPLAAAKFFLSTLALMFALLILGTMMMWSNPVLRILLNAVVMLFAYAVFWQAGLSAGTVAVNLGEILYQRQSTDREIDEKERKRSFHKLKGFLIGLIGCVPVFLCAVILALTAKRVMVGAGLLPSWLESLERREEIGAALASYHQSTSMTLTDAVRLVVRMSLMPMINIVDAGNKDAVLVLERLSPLLVLIPGLSYGLGYLGGVQVRARVHADIEAGKKKIKRRQKRERQRRSTGDHGPGQLN